jgi:hypothetical protein
MAALQAIGCTMAQGALLGQPTAIEAVESLFGVEHPATGAASASPSEDVATASMSGDLAL